MRTRCAALKESAWRPLLTRCLLRCRRFQQVPLVRLCRTFGSIPNCPSGYACSELRLSLMNCSFRQRLEAIDAGSRKFSNACRFSICLCCDGYAGRSSNHTYDRGNELRHSEARRDTGVHTGDGSGAGERPRVRQRAGLGHKGARPSGSTTTPATCWPSWTPSPIA